MNKTPVLILACPRLAWKFLGMLLGAPGFFLWEPMDRTELSI